MHDLSEKVFSHEISIVSFEFNAEFLDHRAVDLLLSVEDGVGELRDGIKDHLAESSLEFDTFLGGAVGSPFLGGGVEEVIAPELGEELLGLELESAGVHSGEGVESESPSVEGGSHGDVTVGGVDLAVSHVVALHVGGDDDVGVFDDSLEVLVDGFGVVLELEEGSVDFVNHEHGSDEFLKGLSEHGFGLDADSFDVIDDDERSVGNSEGGGDFGGEIDVAWGVDQVDEVGVFLAIALDVVLVVEGHSGGFDGDTSLLFVLSGIHISGISGLFFGDNSGLGDEGVS